MSKQFEQTEAAKPEEATAESAAAKKRIDRVANDAAGKATKTVKKYDNEGPTIFSK
ncbi:MAG: hypothetical protein WBX09_20835 [Terracidiphilus sp.]